MKSLLALLLLALPLAASAELKVAALCTAYRAGWHADSIITKFLAGFTTDDAVLPPRVKAVSL